MAGLLEMFNSEQGRMGLGLLGGGFGQQLRQGVESMDAYKKQQLMAKIQEMQMAKAQAEMADVQEQRKAQAAQAMQQQINQGAIRKQIEGGGAFDPRAFLAQNPNVDLSAVQDAFKMNSMLNPAPKYETLAPGASLYKLGAAGPELAMQAPKEKTLPSAVQEYQFAQGQGYKGSFVDFQLDQKKAGASKVAVDMRDPTAVAKAAMGFQNDYRAATKDSYQRAQAYESMVQASADPSAKGDLTMVYSFIKALDPSSVVREGEISLVNANRSIPDQIKGYAQKLATGQNLLPAERQDLINQARTLTQTDYKRSRNDVKAYRDNAQRLGLDPDMYAPDPYSGFKPQGEKPATGKAPMKGQTVDGYKFKGGNPADPNSWERQ